jgi:hypothetical protein
MCRIEQESDPKFKVAKETAAGPNEESVLFSKISLYYLLVCLFILKVLRFELRNSVLVGQCSTA